MSQVVGQVYKSRIPTLGDDASIEEALRVYHYGIDSYSGQPIPADSIEGNFSSLNTRVSSIESTISGLGTGFVKLVSETASPNIVTPQSVSTTPLTIRAIASQTSPLQQWQNSSSSAVASISTGGSLGLLGYLSVGGTTVSSTTASSLTLANSSHKGIVVRGATSQTGNLQEWQNSASTVLAVVDAAGSIASAAYLKIGSSTISTTTAISANILNASHKGITVRPAVSQTANLQEWQNSSGTAVSWVTADGRLFVQGENVENLLSLEAFNPLMLIGA